MSHVISGHISGLCLSSTHRNRIQIGVIVSRTKGPTGSGLISAQNNAARFWRRNSKIATHHRNDVRLRHWGQTCRPPHCTQRGESHVNIGSVAQSMCSSWFWNICTQLYLLRGTVFLKQTSNANLLNASSPCVIVCIIKMEFLNIQDNSIIRDVLSNLHSSKFEHSSLNFVQKACHTRSTKILFEKKVHKLN